MLDHWLSPVRLSSLSSFETLEDRQVGKRISIHLEEGFPDLKGIRAAIIGLGDAESHAVREELYQMTWAFDGIEIADIGDLRKDDPNFVIPVLHELIDAGVIPILIARDKRHLDTQYRSYIQKQNPFKMVLVDSNGGRLPSRSIRDNISYDILNRASSPLSDFASLGHQAHLMDSEILKDLQHRSFSMMRLGDAQANIRETEPLIRDASAFCMSLSALRFSEAPGQLQNYPSGFYSEEACQLCRYAGISDQVSSMGIYGFVAGIDPTRVTATMVAQLAWYFLEGVAQRKDELPERLQSAQEYLVKISSLDQNISFLHSQRTDRWWMRVRRLHDPDEPEVLIPCSPRDYQQAARDQMPDRLFQFLSR